MSGDSYEIAEKRTWKYGGTRVSVSYKSVPQGHKSVKQCLAVCFPVHVRIRVRGLHLVHLFLLLSQETMNKLSRLAGALLMVRENSQC